MYVCMYVCNCMYKPVSANTHYVSIKDVTTKYFYRILFWQGRWGEREGSIMSGLPHQFNDFSADTKQSQINY